MKKGLVVFAFLLVLSLSACIFFEQKEASCPVPVNFSEKEIIGTWVTGLDISHDTLIIKENRTYKQIIHVQTPAFDYESDWLPWSLKISDIGLPYLYLEGMRLCVYWDGYDCQKIGGTTDEWYDFCKQEWVKMPLEGILIVLGPPKGMKLPSTDISLFALQRSTDYATGYAKQMP